MTPFVVVTMARSGSTHLVELLNMHPQVVCNREILCLDHDDWSPARQHWSQEDRPLFKVYTPTDADLIEEAFSRYQVRGEKTAVAAVGCKILEEQIRGRPTTISALQHVEGVRFIVVERRNQLERLRSLAQVELTGQWGYFRADGVAPLPPCPRLDPVWCQKLLWSSESFYGRLRVLPSVRTEWIYYEDLRDHQNDVLQRLWSLLRVDSPGVLESPQGRQETRSLRDSVENFTELCQFFGGSRYEGMLK